MKSVQSEGHEPAGLGTVERASNSGRMGSKIGHCSATGTQGAGMGDSKRIRNAIVRKYPSIRLQSTLKDAVSAMADNNASALVVVDGDTMIGLVTISDVMFSLANDYDMEETELASFMTRCDIISEKGTRNPCAQLDADQDLISAVKVMFGAGVNHLLVSDSEGEAVGVASSLEIIKALAR